MTVAVEGLRKTYPTGVEALAGIDFAVDRGEIFGLLGPNGAGKTTTLGVLTTLVRPSAGAARVGGHDVVAEPLRVRRSIGVVFQDSVLDNDFTGEQNLRFHARLWGMGDAAPRIRALLDDVGLAGRAGDGVATYSGGMRRRLEIARALLARPRVLFLDEPTLGLDPVVRSELWQLIRGLRAREDVTVVVSTHYLEEAEHVCDRVAIVDRGRIAATGTPARLVAGLGRHVLELRLDGPPGTGVPGVPGVDGGNGTDGAGRAARVLDALHRHEVGSGPPLHVGSTITVASDRERDALAEDAARLGLSDLGVSATIVRPATLNDVFLHLTAAGARPASTLGAAS